MNKIIYLPVEHLGELDVRNNQTYDKYITRYLEENNIEYIRIYPGIEHPTELKAGSFLDAEFTIRFKSAQLEEVARLYREDVIVSGDIIFSADIWHPGIESIAYMNYFAKKDVKLRGMLHAGSFTDTDFVRDLERWAKNFEDIIFDISDKLYVGSQFIKDDVVKKRVVDPNKVIVTGFPIDTDRLDKYKVQKKENIVIFAARNVDEKQPWLFDEMAKRLGHKATFINTLDRNYTKDEYYELLSKSKIFVSFALQENFGISVLESVYLGCIPVLPNRLVYPEFYDKQFLYNTFEDCVNMVDKFLDDTDPPKVSKRDFHEAMEVWFEN